MRETGVLRGGYARKMKNSVLRVVEWVWVEVLDSWWTTRQMSECQVEPFFVVGQRGKSKRTSARSTTPHTPLSSLLPTPATTQTHVHDAWYAIFSFLFSLFSSH